MTSPTEIPVLIATLASSDRGPYLLRALASLRAQAGVRARPIVIVNGGAGDPALVGEIRRVPDAIVLHRDEPHLPRALAAGRRLVTTRFFAQLDDDDELLPDALRLRAERMSQPDAPDAVVTNGLIRNGTAETPSIPDVAAVAADPVGTLVERNWLLPGSALFRTGAIDEVVFEATPRFLEWTYIALLLATRYRIAFLPTPTVIHYEGHEFSVDQSHACALGRPRAFAAVLALDLPPAIRRRLRMKRGAAWHAAAEASRADRDGRAAWAAHLRSVASPAGWRYLAYTRHLIAS